MKQNQHSMVNPLTPEKYALSGTEDAHSISLMMWAANSVNVYPELKWLFHIPNGGFRTKAGAGKLKAMGVKPNVPDYCLAVRRFQFAALWIELKRPKMLKRRAGVVRAGQSMWIDYLQTQGHGAIVCVGWEAARDTIVKYLKYKGD